MEELPAEKKEVQVAGPREEWDKEAIALSIHEEVGEAADSGQKKIISKHAAYTNAILFMCYILTCALVC